MGHPLVLVPVTGLTPRQSARRELGSLEAKLSYGCLPGTRVTDWVARQQFITLCDLCVGKFNPKKYGYERWHQPFYPYSTSQCLACKTVLTKCRTFTHESLQAFVGHFPRRFGKGRWGMGH